jgi:hypothetical protein
MPILLNGCRWPACHISSVDRYCFEHARRIRAEIETERDLAPGRDEPMTRERTSLYTASNVTAGNAPRLTRCADGAALARHSRAWNTRTATVNAMRRSVSDRRWWD